MPVSTETQEDRRRRKGIVIIALAAGIGFLFATDIALASNWGVTLNSGSSGEAQAGGAGSLTITATVAASATNLLYPGNSGDVVLQIVNSGSSPVSLTAIGEPSTLSMAQGYTDKALTSSAGVGCGTATSLVTWAGGGALGASVTLATPLVVAANNAASPLVVTLTNFASMGTLAPAACENLYFQMPSLTGVTASVSNATPTSSPATDS